MVVRALKYSIAKGGNTLAVSLLDTASGTPPPETVAVFVTVTASSVATSTTLTPSWIESD